MPLHRRMVDCGNILARCIVGKVRRVRRGCKPGLPPWGPHVRFRRVQTLVRRADRWFDFAQGAALHAVAPHLQASEQQNLELQNGLAREARHRLEQRSSARGRTIARSTRNPGGTLASVS